VTTALYLVYLRGYGGLALTLALPAAQLLGSLGRDPAAGVEVSWQRGRWSLCSGGEWREVVPHRRTVVTGWVICLVYEHAPRGRRHCLWLHADSVPGGDLRRLRARLALQASNRGQSALPALPKKGSDP